MKKVIILIILTIPFNFVRAEDFTRSGSSLVTFENEVGSELLEIKIMGDGYIIYKEQKYSNKTLELKFENNNIDLKIEPGRKNRLEKLILNDKDIINEINDKQINIRKTDKKQVLIVEFSDVKTMFLNTGIQYNLIYLLLLIILIIYLIYKYKK